MEMANKANGKMKYHAFVSKYAMIFVLIVLCLLIGIMRPQFFSITNLVNVGVQACVYGIMALGVTIVIISKGIDLSLGSVVAFCGLVIASLGQAADASSKYFPALAQQPLIVPIIAGLAAGLLVGFVNGGLIAKTHIHPFIATLGTMVAVRGFALIYSDGQPIYNFIPSLNAIGGNLGPIPVPLIIYAIMIVITWVLLDHTRFGTNAFAIGGNVEAAKVSGINVSRNLIKIYSFCGLCCAVAALVYAGRVQSVQPGAADGYELIAIAATTIGGTSQYGGVGTVWGAVVGTLIMTVIWNGMTLLGVNAYWQKVVQGAIIVIAVIVDTRKMAKKD